MRGVGRALAAAGISAYGIRLPGHHAPEDLSAATRAHWRAAVRHAFISLRKQYDNVAVVGQSMGGLLALDLAAQPGLHVDAVVSLAAPMFLYGWRARFLLPLVANTPLRRRWKWVKKQPGNIRDPEARARHPSLRWCHVSALEELRQLLCEVRAKLPTVNTPLLVVHGQLDTTAPVASANILYERVASAHREKVILAQSYHVLTVDVERSWLEREVVGFLHRVWRVAQAA